MEEKEKPLEKQERDSGCCGGCPCGSKAGRSTVKWSLLALVVMFSVALLATSVFAGQGKDSACGPSCPVVKGAGFSSQGAAGEKESDGAGGCIHTRSTHGVATQGASGEKETDKPAACPHKAGKECGTAKQGAAGEMESGKCAACVSKGAMCEKCKAKAAKQGAAGEMESGKCAACVSKGAMCEKCKAKTTKQGASGEREMMEPTPKAPPMILRRGVPSALHGSQMLGVPEHREVITPPWREQPQGAAGEREMMEPTPQALPRGTVGERESEAPRNMYERPGPRTRYDPESSYWYPVGP
jgi:hypothetical protein